MGDKSKKILKEGRVPSNSPLEHPIERKGIVPAEPPKPRKEPPPPPPQEKK